MEDLDKLEDLCNTLKRTLYADLVKVTNPVLSTLLRRMKTNI